MTWANSRPDYGSEWPRIRRAVLAEEPRCRLCGAPSTTVDHIRPRHQGGDDERANLRALCVPCHRTVTAHQGAAALPSRHRATERHPGMLG